MTATTEKSDYLLLFRGMDWYRDFSPSELQEKMTAWVGWFNRLSSEGRCKGGQSLGMEGKVITGADRRVFDGPFAEAKEAVAGYFLLSVHSEEEALAIAKDCPGLPYGVICEVRPLNSSCKACQEVQAAELAAARA